MQKLKYQYLKSLIICFIMVGNFLFGFSQEIKGYVHDSFGQPIASATIKAFPHNQHTLTDDKGYFSLKVEERNSLSWLEVTHIAYKKQIVKLIDSTENELLKIEMQTNVTDLDEVVIAHSRVLQNVIDNSQSVITLDEEFIAKHNTGTFSGALAAVPGVNTMNVGVGIAKPVIRGMGFNRVLVNNRGIKQEGQQWGADHGLEIDPFDVENVKIIKGPASLLFGSDGLGGVINIEENSILSENGNTIELISSFQTNNYAYSNSLEWKGRKNNWFSSARVTYQDYGDYTVPADEFTYAGFNLPIYDNRLKNTAGEELHFSGTVGYQSDKIISSLRVSSFNQKAGIFTGAIGLPRAYNLEHQGDNRNIEVPRQENQHHSITNNTTISLGSDRLEIDLGYQRNIREEMSFPGAHGISPDLVDSNLALGLYLDTYTSNIRYEMNRNPNHQLLFGGQLQYMQNNKDGFEYLLPVYESFQTGLYHYQSLDISEKWIVNAGIRYDFGSYDVEQHLQPLYDPGTLQPTGEFEERTPSFDRNFDNFSGAAGVTFKLNYQNHLKLNLGNSFRFPTAIELSSNGVHHGNFRHELGDPGLEIERGFQADFTYLHQSNNFFLETALFYGYYKNYIYLAPTGNFSPLATGGTLWEYRQNNAIFNGFEVTSSYKFLFGLKADLMADFVQNLNLDSNLPLPLTPQASVGSKLEYGILPNSKVFNEGFVFLSGRYNFAQNRTDRNERETPDSFLVNAGVGFKFNLYSQKLTFNASVNNLFNTAYFNHISRYRLLNIPEQGRNFVFSLRIPVNL
ncbi:TonB-dependent receptor [Galbibacter sp. BG1]|uniref:TonB-dependent receptor n=1 Tax=Galbibacter sp. BG1 TaxID=1170699 RepID=UPI0015BBB239|nr:TonB-dependent receptor [Galbibacter sp. BG1]QLE02115.1 TonB-dependent receptor [Galbibacter sp. BG1]